MERKDFAEKQVTVGGMRLPSEGNAMWVMYHRLPRMVQLALKQDLKGFGVSFATFLRDTGQGRHLDLIPFGRLDFYCTFFVAQGFDNLFDIARQERLAAKSSAQAALVA